MLPSHNKPSEGRFWGLNLQLRHAWRQENLPTLLCSAFHGFVLVIPGQKCNYSEAKIICSQPAVQRAVIVADSSKTGSRFVTVRPAHTPVSPFSHLCFWIHLCLFSLSPHVCFFIFGRFGVKVSISLVQSPTPADHPRVVREAYLFPLFSKSNPASSRKCFRRGPGCHIRSGSVENTPADFIRASTSCRIGHRLITNKCFPQKDDVWCQKAPERRQIWFLLWEQHSG